MENIGVIKSKLILCEIYTWKDKSQGAKLHMNKPKCYVQPWWLGS